MNERSPAKVLILGGNRFVGLRTARRLVELGHDVTVLHRSPPSVPRVRTIQGDREDSRALRRALELEPDAILDMCLYSAAHAETLLEQITNEDVHYVAVSSAAVYSLGRPPPWNEDDPIGPAGGWGRYGEGKAEADACLTSSKLSSLLVLRPTYYIGPGDPIQRCSRIFERALRDLPIEIPGEGAARVQVVDADDMCAILVEALQRRIVGTINVAGSAALTVREFLVSCAERVTDAPRVTHVEERKEEYDEDRWAIPTLPVCVSSARYESTFHHRCRSAQAAIDRAFVAWSGTPSEELTASGRGRPNTGFGPRSRERPRVVLVMPAYYGLGFVEAARERGYETVALASSAEDPGIYGYGGEVSEVVVANVFDAGSSIAALRRFARGAGFDAVVPCTDYVTSVTARVAAAFECYRTPPEAADRARLKDLARASYAPVHGLKTVRHRVVTSLEEGRAAVSELGVPVVFKPVDAACGQHVRLIESDDDFVAAWSSVRDFRTSFLGYPVSGRFLVEEYLAGPEFSIELILFDGQRVFGSVTGKLTSGPPWFVEMGHVVPAALSIEDEYALLEAGTSAVRALGFVDGLFHVEVRVTSDGVAVVETNGRPGGDRISTDLLPLAFGLNVFHAGLDLFLNRKPAIVCSQRGASAIRYVFAAPELQLERLPRFPDIGKPSWVDRWSLPHIQAGKAVPPFEPRDTSSRVGFVITRGRDASEAEQRADRVVELFSAGRLEAMLRELEPT